VRLAVFAVTPSLLALVASAWINLGWVQPGPPWPDPQMTLSEAAALSSSGEAVTLITREHKDPNRAWPVREGILGAAVEIAPLDAAVSVRRAEMVRVLLAHGARVTDDGQRTRLICFAQSVGATAIVDLIADDGGPVPECRTAAADAGARATDR